MSVTQLIRRALEAEPAELMARAGQLIHSKVQRAANSSGFSDLYGDEHLSSLGISEGELADCFLTGKSHWFITTEKIAKIKDHFRVHELERELIINRADKLVSGKMPIFSHEPVEYSGADRWRTDHIIGVRAPHEFYGDIPYLDSSVVGDSKNLWEPNRFSWVYWLGPAYLLTGDEKYFRCFAELAWDWFAQNRYPMGVNYSSALEVAFRSYAIVWALDFFRKPLKDYANLLSALLSGVWTGCNHIENNLSRYFSPNTHLTGEAFALFACGAALPEFAESRRWREIGSGILADETEKQFYSDGTHRELSSCYHLYSTDFYLQATLIAQRCGYRMDSRIPNCAEKLARRVLELAPGDLYLPQFNDCDGGRLTWFAFHPLDSAPALFAASTLWPELAPALKERVARGYALWMTECESVSDWDSTKRLVAPGHVYGDSGEEIVFDNCDSGIFTHSNEHGDYLLVRAGEFGYMDAGHSHDAPIAFTLYFNGQPVIVDSGTGAYTQSYDIRNLYRSARGKNVLLVNDGGPSEPAGWFNWNRQTDVRLLSARRFEGGFYLKARHNGFSESCGFKVEVSREVIFLDVGVLIVVDCWESGSNITPSLIYTLHQSYSINSDQRRLFEDDGAEFYYMVHDANSLIDIVSEEETDQNSEDGAGGAIPGQALATTVLYSPDYGVMGETGALELISESSNSGAFVSVFSRIGAIKRTSEGGVYTVGEGDLVRELKVGVSGKISLGALKEGQKLSAGVEFAR